MINMVNEKERNQNIYIEKRNETNKMLDETLRIINDYRKKIIKEAKKVN